jgi:hypothetical protein
MPLVDDYADFLTSLNSPKFRELWPAQAHILGQYGAFEGQGDVAIELPTGAGKTLIALLIAEAWRTNGKKVAILSANKTLARQMHREGQALGIPTVLMEGRGVDIPGVDKRAYQRGTRVAIMNYWVYFNQNPVIDPADLLVMDDAHLAEHCLHSLFSVEIDRHSHDTLFKDLAAELLERFPEYSVLTDALAGSSGADTPPELLSFIDQSAVADRIREIVGSSPALTADTDLRFRWGRLRNGLREANIYIGLSKIWIRPYVYPLISFPHYADTGQRLYLSATIGDASDLSRRLGVKKITKIPVARQFAEKTSGRRLIVMNRLEEKDIPSRLQAAILTALRIHPKSVWLCSSQAEAEKFKGIVSQWLNENGLVGHEAWVLTSLGDEIDRFKATDVGHLFVGGRFDGMDFSGNECRLVVIATLPRAIDLQEEFISAYLRDSGFMRRRLNQRIVQALGRCNRADHDFGVYILADRRFATHFGRESNREGIPVNMVAEIDMAQDHAEIDKDLLCSKVQAFLRGDFRDYDADLQRYRAGVPEGRTVASPPDASQPEVLGWTAMFANQNFRIAADRFEECWEISRQANLIEMGAFQKWCWAKAMYLESLREEPNARAKSLELLEESIVRGGRASWFNRLRASLNRARNRAAAAEDVRTEYAPALIRSFDDCLEIVGTRGDKFDQFCAKITESLESNSHARYCEGLARLGKVLAYQADRPRYQGATDNRWRGTFGNLKELVTFEAKIEHSDGTQITLAHMGQAHNQLNRANNEFGPLGFTVRGTLVTHLTTIDTAARSSAGPVRIIDKAAISSLWDRVRLLISHYRDRWSIDDVAARRAAAEAIYPKCPPSGWLIRALDCENLVVDTSRLLEEWPQ